MKKIFLGVVGVVVIGFIGWIALSLWGKNTEIGFNVKQSSEYINISPEQALKAETFQLGDISQDIALIKSAEKEALSWNNDAYVTGVNPISGAYPINEYAPYRFVGFESPNNPGRALAVAFNWKNEFEGMKEGERDVEIDTRFDLSNITISSKQAFELGIARSTQKNITLMATSTIDLYLYTPAKTGKPRWMLMVKNFKVDNLVKELYIVAIDATNGSVLSEGGR